MWKYALFVFILIISLVYYWSVAISADLNKIVVKYDDIYVTGVPKLSKKETQKPPYVEYPNADIKKLYTVMLIDPTAPDTRKPDSGPWRHLLMVNVPGLKLQKGVANLEGSGEILSPYHGPNPPVGSGRHNYQLQIYEQPGKLIGPQVKDSRQNWNIDRFVQDNNLYLLDQKTFTVRGI